MTAKLISVLRPVCVISTIALAVIIVLSFWGWELVSWDMFWKLALSYLVLVAASTLVCYIDNPKNLTGRD